MLGAVLNNPSGGIRYHYRAWRGREHAWLPFREALEAWLSSWQPRASTLVIVGPSGGYCLPLRAIARFERFVIFEPDALARYILRRRLQRALPDRPITWLAHDAWVQPLLNGGSIPTQLFGSDCALLFSNVIGQLPYMMEDSDYPSWRDAWRARVWPLLDRMPWASFHDRVSGETAPTHPLPATGERLLDAQIQALYEPVGSVERIELIDHGSQELLPPGRSYRYFHWPLTRRMHHLIEGVVGGPSGQL
jgi:hypothetical protein